MRVICIDDSDQSVDIPIVKKGNVYTVAGSIYYNEAIINGYIYRAGQYYILAECGNEVGFLESMFIKINEDQVDETEFERNYRRVELIFCMAE